MNSDELEEMYQYLIDEGYSFGVDTPESWEIQEVYRLEQEEKYGDTK